MVREWLSRHHNEEAKAISKFTNQKPNHLSSMISRGRSTRSVVKFLIHIWIPIDPIILSLFLTLNITKLTTVLPRRFPAQAVCPQQNLRERIPKSEDCLLLRELPLPRTEEIKIWEGRHCKNIWRSQDQSKCWLSIRTSLKNLRCLERIVRRRLKQQRPWRITPHSILR